MAGYQKGQSTGFVNENETLDPPINANVTNDTENRAVQTAIDTIQKNYDVKVIRDNRNLQIQRLFEAGFQVQDPTGTRKITAKMLQQAFWRTASRMKFLDFEVFGSGRDQTESGLTQTDYDDLVTAGISTTLENGGLVRGCRDKDGLFQKLLMYGDGFLQIGASPVENTLSPIQFSPVSNSNVYFDSYCTSMRGSDMGKRCKKMALVYSMSWGTAIKLYPELEKRGGAGQIPRDITLYKELERNYLQTYKLYDLVEICHFFDLDAMNYTIFAGSQCTVLEEYNGEEYPFQMKKPGHKKGEPYIPVIHFLCQPSTDGFYNHGIGDLLYDLAILTSRLLNMASGHVEENTYPVTIMNVPQGQAALFFNKLELAGQMRAVGKKPVVAMEYDPSAPASGAVTSQSLLTQNLIQEWQIVFNALDQQVARLGINLDDIDRGPNITASQVLAEEESSNSFVKQIMEYNASESEFLVYVAMDMLKQFVKKGNETPVNFSAKIDLPGGGQLPMRDITLGAIAEELRDHNYYVKINARTGAIPSNIMADAQLEKMFAVTPPGSPAYAKLQEARARLHDQKLTAADFMPPQIPQEAPPGAPPQEGGPVPAAPSATDRLSINPHSQKQVAAIA